VHDDADLVQLRVTQPTVTDSRYAALFTTFSVDASTEL
jgi:hypothetical protein